MQMPHTARHDLPVAHHPHRSAPPRCGASVRSRAARARAASARGAAARSRAAEQRAAEMRQRKERLLALKALRAAEDATTAKLLDEMRIGGSHGASVSLLLTVHSNGQRCSVSAVLRTKRPLADSFAVKPTPTELVRVRKARQLACSSAEAALRKACSLGNLTALATAIQEHAPTLGDGSRTLLAAREMRAWLITMEPRTIASHTRPHLCFEVPRSILA